MFPSVRGGDTPRQEWESCHPILARIIKKMIIRTVCRVTVEGIKHSADVRNFTSQSGGQIYDSLIHSLASSVIIMPLPVNSLFAFYGVQWTGA